MCVRKQCVLTSEPVLDQQLGQMYELMQAIRKQGKEGGEEEG